MLKAVREKAVTEIVRQACGEVRQGKRMSEVEEVERVEAGEVSGEMDLDQPAAEAVANHPCAVPGPASVPRTGSEVSSLSSESILGLWENGKAEEYGEMTEEQREMQRKKVLRARERRMEAARLKKQVLKLQKENRELKAKETMEKDIEESIRQKKEDAAKEAARQEEKKIKEQNY